MSSTTKLNIFYCCVITVCTAYCMGACEPEKTMAELFRDCKAEATAGYHGGPNCREYMSRVRTHGPR
jgi:hypothetical protein